MFKKLVVPLLIVLTCGVFLVGIALAAGETIERSVVASGGERVSAGDYILVGTIGEPAASGATGTGVYRLSSGFWGSGAAISGRTIYLPIVFRN